MLEIVQNKKLTILLKTQDQLIYCFRIDNGAYGRTEEDGRSDTMLLLTVNPSTKNLNY